MRLMINHVMQENEGLRLDLRREKVKNMALESRNKYLCGELEKAWR